MHNNLALYSRKVQDAYDTVALTCGKNNLQDLIKLFKILFNLAKALNLPKGYKSV